jgi:hypothetical protein
VGANPTFPDLASSRETSAHFAGEILVFVRFSLLLSSPRFPNFEPKIRSAEKLLPGDGNQPSDPAMKKESISEWTRADF